MATKNIEINTEPIMLELANVVQLIKAGDYFKAGNAGEVSPQLRELQEFCNYMVTEHDKLADKTGNTRLVGKRGRKSETAKVPQTAEEVLAQFKRR